MRRLRSAQTEISYLSTGADDAPLVLCLHGFPDIPRTWASLTAALVGSGNRVVSPWLPGYAPSSLVGPFDAPAVTRSILELIDELSPDEPVRLVGHDWGAVIANIALAQRPERFRAAATLAVPHILTLEANIERHPAQLRRSAYVALFQLPGISDRIVKLGGFRFIRHLWKSWSPGLHPGDEYFDELELCLRASMPAPLKYYRALRSPRTIREVRAIVSAGPILVPTMYLHGERDGCVGVEMIEGQEKHFSAMFEMVKLSDAGHSLHLERPAEVNGAILGWFGQH